MHFSKVGGLKKDTFLGEILGIFWGPFVSKKSVVCRSKNKCVLHVGAREAGYIKMGPKIDEVWVLKSMIFVIFFDRFLFLGQADQIREDQTDAFWEFFGKMLCCFSYVSYKIIAGEFLGTLPCVVFPMYVIGKLQENSWALCPRFS